MIYDILAEQLVKSMNWAVRTDCVWRSVLRHDLHLSDLFSRMLKKSTSGVLASFRGSMY